MKIVVVDDEARQCRGLRNIISRQYPELKVEAFTEADQALVYIKKEQTDIVITDICMPEMDGLELTERLRQEHPEIKTLLLTGYAEFEYARKAIVLGAYEYLLKPANPDKLKETLDKVIEQISQEETLRNQQKMLQKRLDMTLPVYMEKLLNQWVYGWATKEEKKELETILPKGQPDFLFCLLEELEGIHTVVETCGHTSEELFGRVMLGCSTVYLDIKHMNDQKHQELTGKTNLLIQRNLDQRMLNTAFWLEEMKKAGVLCRAFPAMV